MKIEDDSFKNTITLSLLGKNLRSPSCTLMTINIMTGEISNEESTLTIYDYSLYSLMPCHSSLDNMKIKFSFKIPVISNFH